MVCRSTSCGKSSRYKTPPLLYSPAHGTVTTTSLQCCVNFIGCRSRDEWNLRRRVSYTNRSLQRRQRTCSPTFHSSHLRAWSSSSLFIFSQNNDCFTDAHLLRGQKFRCCGTAPVEHFVLYVTTDDQLRTV